MCQSMCLRGVRHRAFGVGSCRFPVNASCWKMWQVAEGTESDFLLDTVDVRQRFESVRP